MLKSFEQGDQVEIRSSKLWRHQNSARNCSRYRAVVNHYNVLFICDMIFVCICHVGHIITTYYIQLSISYIPVA